MPVCFQRSFMCPCLIFIVIIIIRKPFPNIVQCLHMLKINFLGSDSGNLHQHHLTKLCWARAPSCLAQIITLLAMVFAGIPTSLLSTSVRLALLFCAWSISLNTIHFSSIHGISSAEIWFFNHWLSVYWQYKLHYLVSHQSTPMLKNHEKLHECACHLYELAFCYYNEVLMRQLA